MEQSKIIYTMEMYHTPERGRDQKLEAGQAASRSEKKSHTWLIMVVGSETKMTLILRLKIVHSRLLPLTIVKNRQLMCPL